MLVIKTEYRQGILFVRLQGSLINSTISYLNEALESWITKGVTNIVFNFDEVNEIDSSGNEVLYHYYQIINRNNGHSLICGLNHHINASLKSSKLLNYIYEISDELNAIKVMKWNA